MGVAVILAIISGAVGVAWYFSHDARVRRELGIARVRKIGELGEGERGRIVGPARPHRGELLTAPLTGRPCMFYVVRVEIERATDGTAWATLIDEQQGLRFVVEDETGRAIIDPDGARVSLDADARAESGPLDEPTAQQLEILERHGKGKHAWPCWPTNRGLRYFESVIEPNEVIAVLGAGVREPDPERPPAQAYRGDQPTLLRMTSSSRHPLVISDGKEATHVTPDPGSKRSD